MSPAPLVHAISAELTATGWVGIVRKDSSDKAISEPLTLVWAPDGKTVHRTRLPFSMEGDAILVSANLAARRFVYMDENLPKLRLHVWGKPASDATIEGLFPELGGAAVSATQALVVTGRARNGSVDMSNGTRVARYRAGTWSFVKLPKPAEKRWARCFWDAAARPGTDDMVLLQICSAPRREFAYALFRLAPDADRFTRIPFDNSVFNPVHESRGDFTIETDGTIDLSNQNTGMKGSLTLARLVHGHPPWKVVTIHMPTRLMSSVGVWGKHMIFTDGGRDVRESSDSGRTFKKIKPFAHHSGFLGRCNAFGCSFDAEHGGMFLRTWGNP